MRYESVRQYDNLVLELERSQNNKKTKPYAKLLVDCMGVK